MRVRSHETGAMRLATSRDWRNGIAYCHAEWTARTPGRETCIGIGIGPLFCGGTWSPDPLLLANRLTAAGKLIRHGQHSAASSDTGYLC